MVNVNIEKIRSNKINDLPIELIDSSVSVRVRFPCKVRGAGRAFASTKKSRKKNTVKNVQPEYGLKLVNIIINYSSIKYEGSNIKHHAPEEE